jgi:hypothetical protein
MNAARQADYDAGMRQLPPELRGYCVKAGRNGETLSFDEAEVWKRVLDYRIAHYLKPEVIVETHKGTGCGTLAFTLASPRSLIYSCTDFEKDLRHVPDGAVAELIDIDPFGHPYAAIEASLRLLAPNGVMLITNGEMMQVVRGLKKGQHIPTDYRGRDAVRWVREQFIPEIARMTGLPMRFYYCFPTTVRLIMTHRLLSPSLFAGCPQLMAWLKPKPEPATLF